MVVRAPRWFLWLPAAVVWLTPCAANADDDPPPVFTGTLRDNLDGWLIPSIGSPDPVVLNRLQISGTIAGDRLGAPGLAIHAQVFNLSGSSLRARTQDIQAADAIDAVPMTRLFEAWVEKRFGSAERNVAIRLGLMDANADFDTIVAANWLVNSSQGIGADIARSGLNGPSVYPVSSLGARISWTPNKHWTARLAVLDGVPGDMDHPRVFVAASLAPRDGALTIGQVDYRWSEEGRAAVGFWNYSLARPGLDDAGLHRDQGFYAEVESALPGSKHWSGWLRYGRARGDAQDVDGYWGGGVVGKGLLAGRDEDRLGLAFARASISPLAVALNKLPRAEASFEASYQVKLSERWAFQPDAQYIRHPAAVAGAPDALVVGVRLILSVGGPKPAPATDASDTTVPSDTPETKDGDTKKDPSAA
ncbi:carbohydrate porin [Novosphingobium sp. SG707]|uniref:carbohydrate porin n=1 Tax=Novosphingobium sp. SG707 TaxID=2586996 RepID=UPI0017EFBC88|nr:carbohydrate porin [Novosphingobium sp. SG707]NKJ02039.1 porin [Novosphingobium sp. SG707]